MTVFDPGASIRGWARRAWGAISGRRRDDDLQEELAAHIALAEDELRRRGHAPGEAARLARAAAGGRAQALEALREQRGLPWLASSWLDLKLGFRLLVKHRGLTLVGGVAATVAISIAAVVFTAVDVLLWSRLPLDEGDRIVAIQVWDREAGRRRDTTWQDLERWRTSLRSIEDVGAFQSLRRNVIAPDGSVELASVAAISAAGFRVARVPAVVGRVIVDADALPDAAPVAVIGHDVWLRRFGGTSDVLGRELRFGDVVHTIVGVMPPGFAFPFNFRYWVPLRHRIHGTLANTGPEGVVFGRLAPGRTIAEAHAEASALGLLLPSHAGAPFNEGAAGTELPNRAAAAPRIVPYTFAFTGDFEPGALQLFWSLSSLGLVLLLLPPCANIAILNYARIVTRQQEFAARHALGGSRARIVWQLFVESLVLTAVAGLAAIVILRVVSVFVAERLQTIPGGPPFWMSFGVSFRSIVFIGALVLAGAAVSGLFPALQATRRLARHGAGVLAGRTSARLGATWTTLVIVQAAFSVALLPLAAQLAWGTVRSGIAGPGFDAEQYATARLRVADDGAASAVRATTAQPDGERPGARRDRTLDANRGREVARRLLTDPGIAGVSVALQPPGDEPWVFVEIEGRDAPTETLHGRLPGFRARFNQVEPGFLDLYEVPRIAGRTLRESDAATDAVVVNRTFARTIAPGGNALGHRFRYVRAPGTAWDYDLDPERWYVVVGVVGNLPATTDARVAYHATAPGQLHPAHVQLRLAGDPTGLAERVRAAAARVDPAIYVEELRTLADVYREHRFGDNLGAITIVAATLSILLLSAGGLHALAAFTVAQRRREIGIRAALGARPGHVLTAVFGRVLLQVATGGAAGMLAAYAAGRYVPIDQVGGAAIPGIVPLSAAFVLIVAALAASGPARRGLRCDPTEVLRSE